MSSMHALVQSMSEVVNSDSLPDWRVDSEPPLKKLKTSNSGLRKSPNKWTKEENQKLASLVELYGEKKWKRISVEMGGQKTGAQCAQHWKRVLCPDIRKGPWAEDEEELLLNLVAQYGSCWKKIAKRILRRTDIQCRYQYRKAKQSREVSWSNKEDHNLAKTVIEMGDNVIWLEIAENLAKLKLTTTLRTALECKARFLELVRDPQQYFSTDKALLDRLLLAIPALNFAPSSLASSTASSSSSFSHSHSLSPSPSPPSSPAYSSETSSPQSPFCPPSPLTTTGHAITQSPQQIEDHAAFVLHQQYVDRNGNSNYAAPHSSPPLSSIYHQLRSSFGASSPTSSSSASSSAASSPSSSGAFHAFLSPVKSSSTGSIAMSSPSSASIQFLVSSSNSSPSPMDLEACLGGLESLAAVASSVPRE